MPNTKDRIAQLAETFAAQVLEAIKAHPIDDMLITSRAPTKGAPKVGGKHAELGGVVALIVDALKKTGEGMRAEQIREVLGLTRRDIDRPIAAALASKLITKKGQRRGTTYTAR